MTDIPPYRLRDLIRDLIHFAKPYSKRFWVGTVVRIVSDVAWLYPALAVGWLIDHLNETNLDFEPRYVAMILGGFVVASFLHYVGRDIAKYCIYQVAERSSLDASYQTLKHLISLDIEWQEKENSGNKMKRITHGQEGINRLVRLFVDLVVESSINVIFISTIFFSFDPIIAGAMLIYVASYYILSLVLLRKAKDQSHVVNVQEEYVQGQYFEIINNIATVKWMGLNRTLLRHFQTVLDRLMKEIRLRIRYFRTRSGSLGLFNELFRVTLLAYIVWGIGNEWYGIGLLAVFLSYFTKMQLAADEFAIVSSEFIIQKIRISRMMDILKEVPHVEETGSRTFPTRWKTLELKDLTFSYQNRKYLQDINLTIERGQKIGIVGLSGAGKTTLFKLLLNLYEDYEGEILFDGKPLSEIKRSDYLRHTAVVLQETEVFNLSLAENVMMAGAKKDPKRLKQALKVSHITEFLPKLENGVDTVIGEKGVKLSGGEKQRVGIARAIYKDPQILFLDEATSHLDIDSEQLIQDSLKTFFSDITAIVIAHRLSTIKEMDRIIVMKAGRIVEQGSFAYLMQKKGEFARLWQKQLKRS